MVFINCATSSQANSSHIVAVMEDGGGGGQGSGLIKGGRKILEGGSS